MSADDWLQEYHLTPHGWIEGTSTSFGHRGKNVERPNGGDVDRAPNAKLDLFGYVFVQKVDLD